MNWVDIAIIAGAVLFGLLGFWQGFIKALFGILGLIVGIALAGHFYQPLALKLSSEGAAWAGIAAYAIILVVTVIVAGVAGWFVAKMVHALPFGWLDRLLGFILGAFMGSMLCAAVLAILCKYVPGVEAAVAQSAVAATVMKGFPLLLALLPDNFDFLSGLFT
jgi:membrane protein required for colicin V production